jgi:hypothetical protein
MQQHTPDVPISNAAMPAASPPFYHATWRRCLACVALGLTSVLFFSPFGVGPWWWQPVLAATVLFVAALLNANLTRRAGSGLSAGGALRGPVAAGLVTSLLGVAIIVAAGLSYTSHLLGENNYRDEGITGFAWALLEAMLVAVLVGLECALVAQSQPSTPLALLGVILGWTAATVANLAALVFGTQAVVPGAAVYTVLFFLLYAGVGGLALALFGGLLGRGLRGLAGGSAT